MTGRARDATDGKTITQLPDTAAEGVEPTESAPLAGASGEPRTG